ncbi:YbjN domain-containing protein [Odoribacter lunatus]|uniref:YbjN domain-containing protein n=1 Tax=Odoribacter lunatus TaxID=2941335 RepID=UPI00203DE521|nr:YbjN domain-containing protein [Odoribacter lunatus]
MKKTLTFTSPIIASTESKFNVEAFDVSVEAFENHEYLKSFYALLDYINGEFRTKYGNVQGNEFKIPHGSIVVNIKLDDEKLLITAPFVALPEKGRIPLLRQVAGLNFNGMDLAMIYLRGEHLSFEYSCPIQLINPYKIYGVLDEICHTGDKYDDEFETKFGAKRIYEPKITPYGKKEVDRIYEALQLSCKECLDAVKYFEPARKYGYIWNIIDTTLMKFIYFAQPQGQLLNDIQKAIFNMDRDDIPLPEITEQGKAFVEKLQGMTKEELAKDLYFVETFISPKRSSNLQNIRDNFESSYKRISAYMDEGDYMTACIMMLYKFYEMYYYNDLQEDVNRVVVSALKKTSALPWEEAAEELYKAMEAIMEDELDEYDEDEDDEDDDEEEEEDDNDSDGLDMETYMKNVQAMQQQIMQNMQQAMQGEGMQEYLQKVQELQQQMLKGEISTEEYTLKVQKLAAKQFGK